MAELKGLDLLRAPFLPHHIKSKPQGTKEQNDCRTEEKKNCTICGGWHHPKIVHLDYVGHAALTDRLLDADPNWFWEPMAFREGLPAFDATGGLWIRLTVCGHSRIGYGHAAPTTFKEIGSREKEVIGDALRNAAMRFGAALELWHKGDLHLPETEPKKIEESYLDLCERLSENITEIKIGIQKKDLKRACSAWLAMSEEDKNAVWKAPSNGGCFTTEERNIMKSKEFRESNIYP